ncbi:MAG: hypothetical protein PHS84_04340 [Paludibacter sp.]|jgi:hypothetical protein|nr:hypothetical protein [Paludibacter sp.]
MKRLIIYCLLTAILILGIATKTVYTKTFASNSGLSEQQPSVPIQPASGFSNNDFFLAVGLGNGQPGLVTSPSLPLRIIPSFSDSSRINYLVQLQLQQFAVSNTIFLLQSSLKQRNGYYLYHLRKLLI